jgi:DNA (cytosine-5)-methyltransferase 1
MKKIKFRLGELFCGPGGIALGALLASKNNSKIYLEHTWASDYHQDSCLTYKLNFPEAEVICQDVVKLDLNKLKSIDAFAYGFPCNDFSIVGESKGLKGKFGGLYRYGLNILDKFNPKFFVAENVSGLTSSNGGEAFKKIVSELSKAGKNGYDLVIHKYKFEQYGVPQTRHRIIIVGIDKELGLIYKIPSPTTPDKYITSKEALEVPPIKSNTLHHEIKKQNNKIIERLKLIKPGQNVWNAKLPSHLKLNVKNTKMSQIYKRLDPNKPSYTITGSGGGGTHGYHYKEPRALTNRERARIQTFPDKFNFIGNSESIRRQIGMAVPPKGIQIIFESIIKTFSKINYSSVPANIKDFNQKELF